MGKLKYIITIFTLIFLFSFFSCTIEESYQKPKFSNLPSALLNEEIVINGQNFEKGKLQVFFDNEESDVNYITNKKIKVIVPRTIKRFNPTVRIIDLNTNENVLEQTFLLKTPIITGYDKSEISFQQVLTIKGDNFDQNRDFIKVFVSGYEADVVTANYNEIQIYIPNSLDKSNLDVKIKAQLQEVIATQSLKLAKPSISTNDLGDFWVGDELVLEGSGFNPSGQFSSLLVDGKECTIFSGVTHTIRSNYPEGPYKDFFINQIVYKMADHEIKLTGNWEIKNNAIVVDYDPGYANYQTVVYNNKAYAFFRNRENSINNSVALYEFLPSTQKWIEVPNSRFFGFIDNVIYNNNGVIYVQKNINETTRVLSKINLDTLIEQKIILPYLDNRQSVFMLHFQETLYMLHGKTIVNNNALDVLNSYQYDEVTQTWSVVVNELMLNHFKFRQTGHWSGFLHKESLYMNFDNNSHRLNPDLTFDTLGNDIYMVYKDKLITSGSPRGGFKDFEGGFLANIVEHNLGFAYELGDFFLLNNEIYFKKNIATYKLKKTIMDEIL